MASDQSAAVTNSISIDMDSNDFLIQSSQWIPYSKRPEWSDVHPKEAPDEQPIVKIAYSEKFKEIFNYLRAIMLMNEISQRALKLTEDAVLANPANYTCWNFRRRLVKDLNVDLNQELKFISMMILENPKNYQVWEHRRAIVEWKNDFKGELDFIAAVFAQDEKNYHAWQYRQWLIRHFNLFNKDELTFVEQMIARDIRNNSAWNHRFYILENGSSENDLGERDDIKEIRFAIYHLTKCIDNESAWNYLRGLLSGKPKLKYNDLVSFCKQQFKSGSREIFLLEMLAEILTEQICNNEDTKGEYLNQFNYIMKTLVDKDAIRQSYWICLKQDLEEIITKHLEKIR